MSEFITSLKCNILVLSCAFLFGSAGAWLISRFANKLGLVDAPSERSSHVEPTPKGGGVGILTAFVFVCVVFEINYLLCVPVTFLAIMSLVGDRIDISPGLRLTLQFLAALVIVLGLPDFPFFIRLNNLDFDYSLLVILFFGGLAIVYVVGTANFYNFMDGINGIAGISGVVGFGLLAIYGASCGKDYRYVVLCLGMAVACAGFLPFNVPKAKVFMGDVGSILLGFVFAVVVVRFTETLVDFVILVCFLFPFYVDELVTMIERIRRRQSLTEPHRSHLYQVLVNEAGVAHWQVALGYGVSQLIVGLAIWYISQFGVQILFVGFISFVVLFFLVNHRVKSKFCANC